MCTLAVVNVRGNHVFASMDTHVPIYQRETISRNLMSLYTHFLCRCARGVTKQTAHTIIMRVMQFHTQAIYIGNWQGHSG